MEKYKNCRFNDTLQCGPCKKTKSEGLISIESLKTVHLNTFPRKFSYITNFYKF